MYVFLVKSINRKQTYKFYILKYESLVEYNIPSEIIVVYTHAYNELHMEWLLYWDGVGIYLYDIVTSMIPSLIHY